MCHRGMWRGIGTERVGNEPRYGDNTLVAIEQCTECGDYRAVVLESTEVVDKKELSVGRDATSTDRPDADLDSDPDPRTESGDDEYW